MIGFVKGGLLALGIVMTAGQGLADQRMSVPQNGTLRFTLSEHGLTRVSVFGDRIARVISEDQSEALMIASDEATGDLYIRVGEGEGHSHSAIGAQTGFIVLTSGVTLKFVATPRDVEAQAVLVTVTDGTTEHGPREVAVRESRGTGHVSELIVHMRAAIVEGIGRVNAPTLTGDATLKSHEVFTVGSYAADVLIIGGGPEGRVVSRESLRRPGAVAIWVEKERLRPSETAWAVVLKHPTEGTR